MKIEACGVELPKYENHPNRLPFIGILTFVGEKSTKPPGGARGHRTYISRKAAIKMLPSLIGMSISYNQDYTAYFGQHNNQHKVGIITSAKITKRRIIVRGIFYAHHFGHLVNKIRATKMGMSFELNNAKIKNMLAPVYNIENGYFCDAAIVPRDQAAYIKTKFYLAKA